ncbi:MAG TPA: hypothetical protein VH255_01635, partial [Verrucomicrobiae bacterium]|nr:hypothetical protein [Verrucomicrobiae bacterium]
QWQQTNSLLYISNNVHSVVHKTAAATPATTSGLGNGDILVDSDHFTRDLKSGISTYQDNVHVTGTNVLLAAAQMSLTLPLTNGVITLLTNATWVSGVRNGGADELDIDRVTNSLTAIGNAFLKMPGSAMGTNSTETSTNKTVEILSERYVLMTNWAEFHSNVRVTQYDSNQPTGTLTAELVTADIAGGNAIQSVVAETNVVVEQEDGRFTGQLAKFFATNSTAIFSGKPTWAKGDRSGAGDVLFVDQGQSQMTVVSNAMMKLPGNALGSATNTATTNAVPAFTIVTSDNYTVKAGHAEFHGHAHIDDPKMQVTSELLTADSLPGSTNIERIVADKHVVGDLTDSNGKITHVTSDHALYTLSDGLLRLTGTPVLKNDQGWLTGSIIVWDRTYDLLIARNQRMIFQSTNGATSTMPAPLDTK